MTLQNINFIIWFKVARPIKRKYQLSTNCSLILLAAYTLNTLLNKPFTRLQLRKFASYYNNKKIDSYISVLIEKKYIELINSSKTGKVLYYSITLAGVQVINDLNNSYQIELSKFCQTYNIDL
jgi:hypothetical protein